MRSIALFLALPMRDKHLLVTAMVTLLGVQMALRLASVERLRRWASALASGSQPIERIVWAVRSVARRLPGCTCLVSAFALQRLLSRSGHASELHIGVARQNERFAAHAWLTRDDRILIGELENESYQPLLAWKSGPSGPA